MNKRIALYLSGLYPGHYRLPNRFDIVLKLKQLDGVNFSDNMLSLLKDKEDIEFYNTLLDTFSSLHSVEEYQDLLQRLQIPNEVRNDPNGSKDDGSINVARIEEYLNSCDEENFSRYIVTPILHAMGYGNIEYKGKVHETDFGIDYLPVEYVSPGGVVHYAGIQSKCEKYGNGDTSDQGKKLNILIDQIKTGFNQPHLLSTGESVYISEYIIFNSLDTSESVKTKVFNDKDVKAHKVRFVGKDGVLSLIKELGMVDQDFSI